MVRRLQRDGYTHMLNRAPGSFESHAATPIINFAHRERQDARFADHESRNEDHGVESTTNLNWLFGGDLSINGGLAM